ncbi:hypothetical protein ACRAWF_04370 [Streptomyces sp. L7]
MTTHFDEEDEGREPDFALDDPLTVIPRPSSAEYLGPPPGRYESIRRGAHRRRLLPRGGRRRRDLRGPRPRRSPVPPGPPRRTGDPHGPARPAPREQRQSYACAHPARHPGTHPQRGPEPHERPHHATVQDPHGIGIGIVIVIGIGPHPRPRPSPPRPYRPALSVTRPPTGAIAANAVGHLADNNIAKRLHK